MTPHRRWSSVRNQTTIVAAGVVSVALVLAALGLVWLVRARLIDAERSAAALRADDVLALASGGVLPDPLSYPGEERGATQVVELDGTVIAATSNLDGEPALSDLRPRSGSRDSEIRSSLPIGNESRYLVVAATDRIGDRSVTVLAASSLETADETVAALAWSVGLGLPLLVLTVVLMTRLLVGRALVPVGAMTAEVADITQSDLHRRVPEPGTADEIDQLATTLNEMLERLETASDRQRRFVADASHELRSPLASARAVLEVASLHPESEAVLVAAIDDALVDHERLDRLVSDLLALARLDDPAGSRRHDVVELVGLVSDVIGRRTEPGIEIDVDGAATVIGDRALLERVLTNLMDNAERHRGAITRVSLRPTGDVVELWVEDDGPGVQVEDRLRVFEPFTRLDEARRADEGTGLGLAIVHDAVAGLGGTVKVETSPLGGAKFVASLPSIGDPNVID
jgi:signal transduction histidine kinase